MWKWECAILKHLFWNNRVATRSKPLHCCVWLWWWLCGCCGDCDAFLISGRQIGSISDAITALSRSHHQQWGQDDSRKESIKLRSRCCGPFCTFQLGDQEGTKRGPGGSKKGEKFVTTYGCCSSRASYLYNSTLKSQHLSSSLTGAHLMNAIFHKYCPAFFSLF